MKNKSIITFALLMVVVTIIGGFYLFDDASQLRIEKRTDKITIRNGTTGKSIDIVNDKEIENIIIQINSLGLKRQHRANSATGWEIALDFFYAEDKKADTYTIRNNGIEYADYFYGENNRTEDLLVSLKQMFYQK